MDRFYVSEFGCLRVGEGYLGDDGYLGGESYFCGVDYLDEDGGGEECGF